MLLQNLHWEKPYQCIICNTCFTKKTDLKTHQHNHTREEQFQGNNCETHCIGDLSAYSKIILLLFLNLILVFYQFYVLVIYALVQRYFWKFVTELTQGEPISMHYM